MIKISYTADIARKDMNEVLALRAEEQKRKYEEGLKQGLETHCDKLSTVIKNATSRGCSSTTYIIYDWAYNEFLYRAQTIALLILEELMNAGYEADLTKESDESDEWYEFYIHW